MAPLDPVVPVRDRFFGCLVAVDDLQLRQGDGQRAAFPAHADKYFARTFFFRRHLDDVDLVTHL